MDFSFELSRSWLACMRLALRVPPSAISVLRKRSRRRAAACAPLTASRDACRRPQLPIAATFFNAPKTCKRIRESSARYSTFKPTLRSDTAAFVSCRACSERPRDDSRRAIYAHAVLMLLCSRSVVHSTYYHCSKMCSPVTALAATDDSVLRAGVVLTRTLAVQPACWCFFFSQTHQRRSLQDGELARL